MLKRLVSGIMLTILLMGTLYTLVDLKPVAGWSNGGYSSDPSNPNYGTHDWIAQHALDWLSNAEKEYIVNNLAIYLYGTELPDNSGAPDGIGDTALHHIYYWSNESLQDDASATRAQTEYSIALSYIKSGNVTIGAKTLGIMSHYIADVSVFGHVMGSETEWGSEVHHSDYETYVDERTNSYDAEFNAYLAFDGSLDKISAYDAACTLAYDTTFDVDVDLTCVWMDQNYDWSNQTFKDRCGESLNLAVNVLADVLHTFYTEAFGMSGKVTEVDGVTPIAGAMVEALQEGDLVAANTTTDSKGDYYLALSAGVYKMCAQAESHITAIKPVVNTTENGVTVNFNLARGQMLVFDEFMGTSLNTGEWNSHLTGLGSISIGNTTEEAGYTETTGFSFVGLSSGYGRAGSAAITSKASATVDSTIIFEGRISAYWEAHWYPGVYGDGQPRGLRVGTDPDNAIEFISYARDTVEARTIASGIATTSQYLLPSGKMVGDWNLTYRIEVSSTSAQFYVDGVLVATHTTNIPTGQLNIYLGTSYDGYGNVPVSADYLYMALAHTPEVPGVRLQLSVFSAYGLPSPGVGSWLFDEGDNVTCWLYPYWPEGEVVWACTGWTGTGSVPPSDNGTSLTDPWVCRFQIHENSTITWNWQIVQTDTFLTFEKSSYQFMVDKEFDVTITVQNVSDFSTWQLSLNFDPNIIEYVNVSIPLDNVFDSLWLAPAPDVTNASDGFVTLGASLGPGAPAFNGSGKLCTFRFIGKSVGNTSLTFLNFGWDTFLLNARVQDMPFKVADSRAHSILFQGDVNNDGIVNMRDINDAILAFSSFPGGVRWNPAADLDNSGRVDMRDIVIIALNFNKHE